jgi:hypothetical protein
MRPVQQVPITGLYLIPDNGSVMKAVVFAMVTLLVGSASVAESVYVTTELTRNGERVDS